MRSHISNYSASFQLFLPKLFEIAFALMDSTPSRSRVQYRRYLRDSAAPIPKSTFYRHLKQAADTTPNHIYTIDTPSPTHQLESPSPTHQLESPFPTNQLESPSPTNQLSPQLQSPTNLVSPSPTNQLSPQESLSSSIPTSDPFVSDNDLFSPLYPGAEITKCGALCAIMQFCTANKLSYTAIGELLKLLTILCPFPNLLPGSLYKFKKFFQQFNPIHDHRQICLKCKESDCLCANLSVNNTAHLVNVEIQKPLEKIITGMYVCVYDTVSVECLYHYLIMLLTFIR